MIEPTRPITRTIGVRRRPDPGGQPSFVRADTVHQGDLDRVKGVYHLNVVDECTQHQHIGTVPAISERFLIPVLKDLLKAFPFAIQGFHADNGSEYINPRVAGLLHTLHIGQFTKCRPRHCNDNARVEGKNAAVVRKWLGHAHLPQRHAALVNAFCRGPLSPFLNFHRPCLLPSRRTDANGRIRGAYRDADVMAPFEKLRTLPGAERCLSPQPLKSPAQTFRMGLRSTTIPPLPMEPLSR